MLQEVQHRPASGLQSYIDASPDYELYPVGIASIQDQAKKLAEYGRNGDIYIVHATEGETVIPMEVLNANPKVKSLLFTQMKDMGLEPSAYVVGNQLNSINPVTGVPEFFFRSIFKGIKKAVKSVLKFAKKAAPIALPIAASLFGIPGLSAAFPTIFGAGKLGASMLASGIGSLVGGGSLKDAFKSAALSGGISAGIGGLTGLMTGKGFLSGVQGTLPGGAKPPTAGQQWDRLTDVFTGETPVASLKDFLLTTPPTQAGRAAYLPQLSAEQQAVQNIADKTRVAMGPDPSKGWSFGDVLPENMGRTLQQAFPGAESAYTVPGGETLYGPAADAAARAEAIKTTLQSLGGVRPTAADLIKAGDKAVAAIQPGILQKWGTVGALGAGAMALGGGFKEAKEEDVTLRDSTGIVETETGVDLLAEDPERYVVQNLTPYSDAYNQLLAERLGGAGGVAYAARGGGVNHFPRRTGHIRGPGTPTSDDVPAMLSDGEFVMTKRAVDGAGGPNNMYKMMRNFEMKT